MLDPSIIVDTHQVPAAGGLVTGSQSELENAARAITTGRRQGTAFIGRIGAADEA